MIWEWGCVSVPLLQSLAAKHSDVKSQHIVALLAMRGDLGRNAVIKVSSLHMEAPVNGSLIPRPLPSWGQRPGNEANEYCFVVTSL